MRQPKKVNVVMKANEVLPVTMLYQDRTVLGCKPSATGSPAKFFFWTIADESGKDVLKTYRTDEPTLDLTKVTPLEPFVPGKKYSYTIIASNNKKQSDPVTRDFTFPNGTPTETSTAPAKETPEVVKKPLPKCEVATGNVLVITPQQGEGAYDIYILGFDIPEKQEELLGSKRIPVVTTVGNPFNVSDVLDKVGWIQPLAPGNHKLGIAVSGVYDGGETSDPIQFGPFDFIISEPKAENAAATGPETAPVSTETPPTTDAADTAPTFSPEEIEEVKDTPRKLGNVRNDLASLPLRNGVAREKLEKMATGLKKRLEILTAVQAKFGNKPDGQTARLIEEANELTVAVEGARAIRLPLWLDTVKPRIQKIGRVLEQMVAVEDEQVAQIEEEFTAIKAIVDREDPPMTCKEVNDIAAKTRDIIRKLEVLKPASNQRSAGADNTGKGAPESAFKEIEALLADAEAKLDEEKLGESEKAVRIAGNKLARLKSQHASADTSSLADRLETVGKAIADAKAKADANKGGDKDAEERKRREDAEKKRREEEEKKRKEEAEKARKADEAKPRWYSPSAIWNRLRKHWFLWLLTAAILALITWVLAEGDAKKKVTDVYKKFVQPAPVVNNNAHGGGSNAPSQGWPTYTAPAVSGVPSAMMASANNAQNFIVASNRFGKIGKGAIVGSQVVINNTSNTFIIHGIDPKAGEREFSGKTIQIPRDLAQYQPGNDGCRRWTNYLAQGQGVIVINTDTNNWEIGIVTDQRKRGDLKSEVFMPDGIWHEMPADEFIDLRKLPVTDRRYSVKPNAQNGAYLEFTVCHK